MKQISMQMIADSLDISKNSVSQALRGESGVSEETKIRVLTKAKEMGYQYDKKKREFLILATEFALLHYGKTIVKGIEQESAKSHFKTTVSAITPKMIENNRLPDNLTRYDGILIVSHITNNYIVKIIESKIPCIVIDHHSTDFLTDCILTKNTDGAYQAIKFLIDHQCNRIGFIGDIEFSPSYLERFNGYKRALSKFNIELDSSILITEIHENQAELFPKLKKIDLMPDAWFCVNSGLAYLLNVFLQSEGYKIPEDISIISFDNTHFTQMAIPRLTNVSINFEYMGSLAVKTLIERIKFPDTPYLHQQIIPTLTVLESVK
ncbi:MAG: LacI family DNA-binding transcriptional regulator [Streptococcus sp.]|nr:LacI family DNA-binding transcriptional regulator [Streptococcus sp.]